MRYVNVAFALPESQAMALAQMCKRFGRYHAHMLANAHDGGKEQDEMLDGIAELRRALAQEGFAPR